ncbi:MAG: class I ribonucleotide reductase maintenance protein YfaE, partial [Shewanella sp.]
MTSKKRPQNLFAKAPIVRLQGQPVLLFTEQQGSLLQALEAKKVSIFSECRNGFCGACKTRIISGKVRYLTEPLAELKQDECLPCCCVPTEDLELDLSPEGAAVVTNSSFRTPSRVKADVLKKSASISPVLWQKVTKT